MCQTLCNQGNAVTILRPSNAYGPSQTRRDGFGLVCTLLDHARKGTPMEIWGDGGNVRDFVYIDDVVDVTLHLIRTPQDAGIYNLGSGVGHSVNEVKSLVEHVTGLRVQTVHRPARGIDVRAVVLDCTRLRDRLQWHPCQELRKGVERTWFTNQLQTS
jgi:UDP-glucose 4-epimerase